MNGFLFFGFFAVLRGSVSSSLCTGKDGLVCCAGYRKHEITQQCIKCPEGYVGENCTQPCIYPTYGFRCQKTCRCVKEMCNFSVGCFLLQTASPFTTFTKEATSLHAIMLTMTTSFEQRSRSATEDNSMLYVTSLSGGENLSQETNSNGDLLIGIFALCSTFVFITLAYIFFRLLKIFCHCRRHSSGNSTKTKTKEEAHYLDILEEKEVFVQMRGLHNERMLYNGLARSSIKYLSDKQAFCIEIFTKEDSEIVNPPLYAAKYESTECQTIDDGLSSDYREQCEKSYIVPLVHSVSGDRTPSPPRDYLTVVGN